MTIEKSSILKSHKKPLWLATKGVFYLGSSLYSAYKFCEAKFDALFGQI